MAIPGNPVTRKERFLAKAAGESVNTPEPITREEMYLDAIASGGGSGGGGSVEPLIVQLIVDGGNKRMDKTWQEIHDAMLNGVPAYVFAGGTDSVEMYPILECLRSNKGCTVNYLNSSLAFSTYSALTPNDYPTLNG